MAYYDWNSDEKKDDVDDFIEIKMLEYHLQKIEEEKRMRQANSNNSGCFTSVMPFIMVIIVIIYLGLFN